MPQPVYILIVQGGQKKGLATLPDMLIYQIMEECRKLLVGILTVEDTY